MLKFLFTTTALCAAHVHPDATYFGPTAEFYSTWMQPDNPTVSCCNRQDCAPVLHIRKKPDGAFEAQRVRDGAWLTIPEKKIERNRDSPDGLSHMCSAGSAVFCFVLGTGG